MFILDFLISENDFFLQGPFVNVSPPRTGVDAEPIGVFWDIENCRIPKGKSATAIVNRIREVFYPGRREVEFMCVCDTTKEKKEVLEELNRAQVLK